MPDSSLPIHVHDDFRLAGWNRDRSSEKNRLRTDFGQFKRLIADNQLKPHCRRITCSDRGVIHGDPSPPFVLDFAGACLDQEPDDPDEVLAEWQANKAEQSGDRQQTDRLLMSSLVSFAFI